MNAVSNPQYLEKTKEWEAGGYESQNYDVVRDLMGHLVQRHPIAGTS